MRKDMPKVITERPRSGARLKDAKGVQKLRQRIPLDEQPRRESIGRKWLTYFGGKEFTDVIGPLRGYILKQVGRPWDKVWSEICQTIPAGGVSLNHARRHVFDFVELHVRLVNGRPYLRHGSAYRHRNDDGLIPVYADTYVCPLTGLLKKTPPEKRRPREPREVTRVWLNATTQLLKCDKGIWYELKFIPLPDFKKAFDLQDIWTGKTVSYSPPRLRDLEPSRRKWFRDDRADGLYRTLEASLTRWYGAPLIPVSKRQINKREIRKHGLRDL